jgi:VPDSG-CTERM motif
MSKSTLKILPALMIAIIAALVTQPMRAGAIDTLLITENSSTSLTAILNGTTSLTVTPGLADNWSIALTGISGLGGFDATASWTEPGAAGFLNLVSFQSNHPSTLFVRSDFFNGNLGLANNTADMTFFTLNLNPLFVTFNDLGDVATVPDTGTTFSLFGLSLMGLGFLRRKLC